MDRLVQFWCPMCDDWLYRDGVIHSPGGHTEEQDLPRRWREAIIPVDQRHPNPEDWTELEEEPE